MSYVKKKPTSLNLRKALDLMHRTGTRLIKTRDKSIPSGFAYYVTAGGYVDPETAEKIKKHPAAHEGKDGLFPGHDQTWRFGT